MRLYAAPVLLLLAVFVSPRAAWAWVDPESTVRMADEILRESMNMAAKRIPEALLAEAEGVAIIPDVIKIGFVAAVRRGHGVVLVRDANGAWTLPQFITLTGGSVGWQAGIQGTDVILVFTTKKSVQGLLTGKFTIGADASVAAGPVGRNAAAATDARLKAEILSYSRSRGLFVGVSLDGSAIEMNTLATSMYYGAPAGQPPQRVPQSALRLVQDLVQATETGAAVPGEPTPPGDGPLPADSPTPADGPTLADPAPAGGSLREQLATSAGRLYGIVDQGWRNYLALPPAVFQGGNPPSLVALQGALKKYDNVMQSPQYETLVSRQEFQATYGLLRDYIEQLSRSSRRVAPELPLPPPPVTR